jgi:hypothetical protein
MISTHTSQSIPVTTLAQRGVLTPIGNGYYRHDAPGTPTLGVGPVGSIWRAEPSYQVELKSIAG